jgi:hypothetical protein
VKGTLHGLSGFAVETSGDETRQTMQRPQPESGPSEPCLPRPSADPSGKRGRTPAIT